MSRAHSYEEFFAAPLEPGRFWWTEEGVTMMLQWGEGRAEHIHLYVDHHEGDWARPGPVSGWDGNLDEPTLSPSIGVNHRDEVLGWAFHGFLQAGKLVLA